MADDHAIAHEFGFGVFFIEVEAAIERWRGYKVCTHPECAAKQAECPQGDFEGTFFLVFKFVLPPPTGQTNCCAGGALASLRVPNSVLR